MCLKRPAGLSRTRICSHIKNKESAVNSQPTSNVLKRKCTFWIRSSPLVVEFVAIILILDFFILISENPPFLYLLRTCNTQKAFHVKSMGLKEHLVNLQTCLCLCTSACTLLIASTWRLVKENYSPLKKRISILQRKCTMHLLPRKYGYIFTLLLLGCKCTLGRNIAGYFFL